MLAGVMAAWLVVADPGADKAASVLAEARAALGLRQARSLRLRAEVRRAMPAPDGTAGEMSGEVRVEALVPGRYRRVESLSPFPGAPPFPITFGLDAESAWTHAPAHHGGGGAVVMRMRPAGGAADEGALRRRLRGDYARLALATLLAVDAAAPLSVRHVAVAEAPEGQADVLEVTGPDGFTTRLFVDTATRRPLMLTYRERRPRMIVRRMDGPGTGAPRPPQTPLAPPEDVPEEEATLHLDDFRKVGDTLLPHRLAWSYDGQPAEEWTVREWALDPALDPAAFRKK
jgi:hypothetical protein